MHVPVDYHVPTAIRSLSHIYNIHDIIWIINDLLRVTVETKERLKKNACNSSPQCI